MRKLVKKFAVVFCLLVFSIVALADQAAWITKDEAQKAEALLKKQKEIKHFCAPCQDKSIRTEEISSLISEKVDGDYWHVKVNNGEIDLAYVYFKTKDNKWKNLAIELKIDVSSVPEFLPEE